MPSSTHLSSAERARAYRQDICAAGGEDVPFGLPSEIGTLLDALKQRLAAVAQALALLQLLEQRRATTQHTT
jgi:hypothetical protein